MKLIPQKEVDRRLKNAYGFNSEFYGFADKYFRESFPGLSVSHVLLYFYRRFGTVYGGDEKTAFDMWFDVGDMFLSVHGCYHQFIYFRLSYKSKKTALSDQGPFYKERQSRWRKRIAWLRKRRLVDMWDAAGLDASHPLMQFAEQLYNEGDYKGSDDFWDRQAAQVEAIKDKMPEEIKMNFAKSLAEFPIADAAARYVVSEFLKTVYIRDLYLNILGMEMGDGQDDLSAAEQD
jgi:hypothetical protein